jgi:amino acid permease
LEEGLAQGLPVFAILSHKEGMQLCALWGQIFSLFAIITSLIGVSLTVGSALQDCFSRKSIKLPIIAITVFYSLRFPFIILPFSFAHWNLPEVYFSISLRVF